MKPAASIVIYDSHGKQVRRKGYPTEQGALDVINNSNGQSNMRYELVIKGKVVKTGAL